MSVQRPNWEAITSVEPNRESILRAILFATERECTPEELLETRAVTGYLKMARRMVDQFVQGATRFIVQTDFDAEGITSGVILERHLKRIAPVSVRIPTRAQGQTLARLRDQQPPSLLPLLPKDLTAQGLSFFTIPKINAVSRMSHPMLIYCILSSDEPAPATFDEIVRQNQQRQDVTAIYLENARPQVNADAVQVIYIPDMPASIAGLIASRLSDELFKPVLCVCNQDILRDC